MIGIVGEPQTGKSSLLSLLLAGEGARRGRQVYEAVVPIPDRRLEWLARLHQPRKVTPATLDFTDLGADPRHAGVDLAGLLAVQDLRVCEGIALVLDRFRGGEDASDLEGFDLAAAVADLDLVERRLERLRTERQRGRKEAEAEIPLMERLREHLEGEQPLRTLELGDADRARLRGYQFLSLKPVLVVANVAEDAAGAPPDPGLATACAGAGHELVALSAPLEAEIAGLEAEERRAFMDDLGIAEPAVERFLRSAYASLGLISFLTAGKDECRAWSIPAGATAPEAAGRIHTDLQRGFIRAEVVAFHDLETHGDEKAAKAAGVYRLEGKDYVVRDGDVVEVRFSV
jgi:GTP-binding protein YchF